jgi:putative peptidoglycan lipid II flippase
MTLTFLVLIALSLLLTVASPVLLRFIAGSFAPAKLALTQSLFYVFVPLVVVTGLSALWAAVLNMGGSFALPSLTSALVPICAAGALVVWGDVGGIWALAAGTLGGGVCELLVLGAVVKKQGTRVLPCRISMDTFAWQFLRQWSVLAIAALLSLATMTIDQSMASMLGPGNVGALNYGFKVVATLWTLGPVALGTVVLPYLSRYTAQEDYEKLLAILKTNALIGLAAAIPLTIVLVSWTEEIIRVLFQRGAFSAQDTVVVGGVQAMYAIGLPFITIHAVGSRLLSAILMNRVLAVASAVALILKVFLNYLLMAHMGVKGIALATSLVYVLQTGIVLGAIWWADLRGKRGPDSGDTMLT